MKLSTHVCLAQLDRHQACKPVMVSCEFNELFTKTSNILLDGNFKISTQISLLNDFLYSILY